MRSVLLPSLCAAVLIAMPSPAQQPAPFYLHSGDRVVFYGDSITDQKMYTTLTETYVVTRYPSLQVSFINSGWGGDRVSGGGDIATRLSRDVIPYKPTVVTIMLGMNDGGYKAPTVASNEAFFTGFAHIVDTITTQDPGVRITAIAPSPYDNVTRPPAMPVVDGTLYNQVLLGYSKWIARTTRMSTTSLWPMPIRPSSTCSKGLTNSIPLSQRSSSPTTSILRSAATC